MTKPNKSLNDVMQGRNPLEMRQVIKPVDILETEHSNRSHEPNEESERTGHTTEPNNTSERENRTVESNERTERTNRSHEPKRRVMKPNARNERVQRTVFDDLEGEKAEESRRPTERYSFEIYTDQKLSIEEVQYLYKKKTGKKLSASRLIREALEDYLMRALKALKEEDEGVN